MKNLILAGLAFGSLGLVACNGGGSGSSSTPLMLASGTYVESITAISAPDCDTATFQVFTPDTYNPITNTATVTSNGSGTISSGSNSYSLVTGNPCLNANKSAESSGISANVSMQWTNCSLNSSTNVLSANLSLSGNSQSGSNNVTASCTAIVTLTPQAQ